MITSDPALPEFYRAIAAGGSVRRLIELARDEDLGVGPEGGDITSMSCIPAEAQARAAVVARQACVVAGLAVLPTLLEVLAPGVRADPRVRDGEAVEPGAALAAIEGPARQVLALERTMLNLLSRLSGVATRTAAFVRAIPEGAKAALYDTRKTTPGLRILEKYAVRCGGGRSHRMGLHDAVLIKDNHLVGVEPACLGEFIAAAAARARSIRPGIAFVEVETDTIEQLERVLALGPGVVDLVLLDNMSAAEIGRAVRRRDAIAPGVGLEVSGGVTLETIADLARTGVERISCGSLTHHAVWVDLGLDAV